MGLVDDTAESIGEYEEHYALCNLPPPSKPTATVWVTREGQRVPVKQMSDQHLVNVIRYLRRTGEVQKRHHETALYSGLGFLNGEGALDCPARRFLRC